MRVTKNRKLESEMWHCYVVEENKWEMLNISNISVISSNNLAKNKIVQLLTNLNFFVSLQLTKISVNIQWHIPILQFESIWRLLFVQKTSIDSRTF